MYCSNLSCSFSLGPSFLLTFVPVLLLFIVGTVNSDREEFVMAKKDAHLGTVPVGVQMDRNAFRMSFGKRNALLAMPSRAVRSVDPRPLSIDRNAFRMSFGKRMVNTDSSSSGIDEPINANVGANHQFRAWWSPAADRWEAIGISPKRLDRNLFNVGFGRRR